MIRSRLSASSIKSILESNHAKHNISNQMAIEGNWLALESTTNLRLNPLLA